MQANHPSLLRVYSTVFIEHGSTGYPLQHEEGVRLCTHALFTMCGRSCLHASALRSLRLLK